jgi:putative transposase
VCREFAVLLIRREPFSRKRANSLRKSIIADKTEVRETASTDSAPRASYRSGAFLEEHYHAIAVETDAHLYRCMIYINLSRIRAGEEALKAAYEDWIGEALTIRRTGREEKWAESIAVGGESLILF